MGKIDDALLSLEQIQDKTERALDLAGLISTLFKIKGVALIVTGRLAYDSYANASSPDAELELSGFAGKATPRMLQEIMGEQLKAEGSIDHWKVVGIPVRFYGDVDTAYRDLCRDFMTDHGVVKLLPVEEITVRRILAAVYPSPHAEARAQAIQLLMNGLTEAFHMNWQVLQALCHQPEYRVGEDLAQMRAEAKQQADMLGLGADPVGETAPPPSPEAEQDPENAVPAEGTEPAPTPQASVPD